MQCFYFSLTKRSEQFIKSGLLGHFKDRRLRKLKFAPKATVINGTQVSGANRFF